MKQERALLMAHCAVLMCLFTNRVSANRVDQQDCDDTEHLHDLLYSASHAIGEVTDGRFHELPEDRLKAQRALAQAEKAIDDFYLARPHIAGAMGYSALAIMESVDLGGYGLNLVKMLSDIKSMSRGAS